MTLALPWSSAFCSVDGDAASILIWTAELEFVSRGAADKLDAAAAEAAIADKLDPFIAVAVPYRAAADPFVDVVDSFVAVADPFIAVAVPYRAVADPFVDVVDPFVAVADPFVAVEDPFVAVADPLVADVDPFVSARDLLVELVDPLVEVMDVFVAAADPFVALEEVAEEDGLDAVFIVGEVDLFIVDAVVDDAREGLLSCVEIIGGAIGHSNCCLLADASSAVPSPVFATGAFALFSAGASGLNSMRSNAEAEFD